MEKAARPHAKTREIFPIGCEIDEAGRTPDGATFPSQQYVEDLRAWCGEHEV